MPKMNKTILFYHCNIPSTEQVNWLEVFCRELSLKRDIIVTFVPHDVHYSHLTFRHILNPKSNIWSFWSGLLSNKTSFLKLRLFNILPFEKIPQSNRLNKKFRNAYWKILRELLRLLGFKILCITNYPNNETTKAITSLQPIAKIADATDVWPSSDIQSYKKYFDHFFVNSSGIESMFRSSGVRNVTRLSAGYLRKKNVQAYAKKSKKKNAVLFLGSVSWRIDLRKLKLVISKMKSTHFVFYCSELFDFWNPFSNTQLKKLLKESTENWAAIKNMPNTTIISVSNQDELSAHSIEANVGILPYRVRDPYDFNYYSHPIKYYQYSALKLPMVSSNILFFRNSKDTKYVTTASTANEWVKKIQVMQEYKLTKSDKRHMEKIAMSQTVEKKADQVEKFIKQLLSSS